MRKASRAIVIKENNFLVMDRNKFGLKYLSLIGGEIEPGETAVQALYREVQEETGITITNPRLVIVEDAGDIYGVQYIYLCDYVSGEPKLADDSPEALITMNQQNIYTPTWVALDLLEQSNLQPKELKESIVNFIANGFPDQPISLTIRD